MTQSKWTADIDYILDVIHERNDEYTSCWEIERQASRLKSVTQADGKKVRIVDIMNKLSTGEAIEALNAIDECPPINQFVDDLAQIVIDEIEKVGAFNVKIFKDLLKKGKSNTWTYNDLNKPYDYLNWLCDQGHCDFYLSCAALCIDAVNDKRDAIKNLSFITLSMSPENIPDDLDDKQFRQCAAYLLDKITLRLKGLIER